MEIIIYCDKEGNYEVSDGEFRSIEVSTIDEDEIDVIIKRSIENGFNLTKVIVLEEKEYIDLNNKAKEWDNYIKWKNAKLIYEKDKEKYID